MHGNIKLLPQVVPCAVFALGARDQLMKLMSVHAVALFIMKKTWEKVVAEESLRLKDYEWAVTQASLVRMWRLGSE